MPEEVYNYTKKSCKINSQIGILATEATLNTKIYHKYFNKRFKLEFTLLTMPFLLLKYLLFELLQNIIQKVPH